MLSTRALDINADYQKKRKIEHGLSTPELYSTDSSNKTKKTFEKEETEKKQML